MNEEEEEATYSLVLPFVACASKGGAFADLPFVAGYQCGLIDAELGLGFALNPKPVYTALLRQLDLIAMRHGYHVVVMDSVLPPSEWSTVRFERTGDVTL